MKKLFVSVLALLAVTAVFAVPGSYKPSTGGLFLPTAEIAKSTTLSTQILIDEDNMDSYCAFDNLQVVLPVGQFVELEALNNLEVSARYDFVGDEYNELLIGAKYVLPIELENLSVAVGGQYATTWIWDAWAYGLSSDAYLAATYSFGETLPLSVTAGAVYDFDLERIQYGASAEYDFGMAQAGLEYFEFNPFSGLDDRAISVYATADLYKGFGATVAYEFHSGNYFDDYNIFTAGLKYTF